MYRSHLVLGFGLLLLAGMAFAGLRLDPLQPFVQPVVMVVAVVGGIQQFVAAVLAVSNVNHRQLERIVAVSCSILVLLSAVPAIAAVQQLLRGELSFGSVITVAIELMLGIAVAAAFGAVRRTSKL